MPSGRIAASIERQRIGWRLSSYGNRQFLGEYGPGHFYSPLPEIDEVRRTHADVADCVRRDVPGIDLVEWVQLALVHMLAAHQASKPFTRKLEPDSRFHLDNPFFSFGDPVVLWSMPAQYRRSGVIEAGSGDSSAAMLEQPSSLPPVGNSILRFGCCV